MPRLQIFHSYFRPAFGAQVSRDKRDTQDEKAQHPKCGAFFFIVIIWQLASNKGCKKAQQGQEDINLKHRA